MTGLRLRTRLTIWFAASILLILVPFLVTVLVIQWRSMREALDHHLEEDLEVAAEMVVRRDAQFQWRTEATRDLGYDAGAQRWVEVFSAAGDLVFARGAARQPFIRAAIPVPARSEPGLQSIRTPAGARVRTLTLERDIGGEPVWIRVARNEDELRRDLRLLVIIFSIVAPVAVLGAALAGHIISGRALAPLSRMADHARSIHAEHLAERLAVENPSDELGQLALVFNDTFARLQASFDRLKRFSADASHELRTPLTAIRSVGEVGLREARTADELREVIGSMLEEADRLNRLVDTLLMLSRWESGRVQRSSMPVDLAVVVREVFSALSVLAEERRITMDLVASASAILGDADPTMVRQALMNVIDNAIKFTRESGWIAVTLDRTATDVVVVVDDEGPGIPPAERGRVTERFYRVDGGGAYAARGSGLGLAIVASVMAVHQGAVEIDESPAGGTRVTLRFPVRPPQAVA